MVKKSGSERMAQYEDVPFFLIHTVRRRVAAGRFLIAQSTNLIGYRLVLMRQCHIADLGSSCKLGDRYGFLRFPSDVAVLLATVAASFCH